MTRRFRVVPFPLPEIEEGSLGFLIAAFFVLSAGRTLTLNWRARPGRTVHRGRVKVARMRPPLVAALHAAYNWALCVCVCEVSGDRGLRIDKAGQPTHTLGKFYSPRDEAHTLALSTARAHLVSGRLIKQIQDEAAGRGPKSAKTGLCEYICGGGWMVTGWISREGGLQYLHASMRWTASYLSTSRPRYLVTGLRRVPLQERAVIGTNSGLTILLACRRGELSAHDGDLRAADDACRCQ